MSVRMNKVWLAALLLTSSALAVAQSSDSKPAGSSKPEESQTAKTPETAPKSQVRQLTDEEILEAVEKKEVFLLDVREPKELETLGTVKGYVNIPVTQLEGRLKELPKDKLILTL